MTEPRGPSRLTPAATLIVLAAWIVLLLVTHHGPRSPHTYVSELTFGPPPLSDLGRVAAPDALTVLPVTRFFYDGTLPADFEKAHNLLLPLHSLAASVIMAFVRNYLWANSALNALFVLILLAAALRFGLSRGFSTKAMLLALATLAALPPVVSCLGQPMQYIVGPAITFLVLLTMLALSDDDLRNPWIVGSLTAVLTLNYHWYASVAAVVAYLAIVRFRRRRDDAIFVIVAASPVVVWELFVRALAAGHVSTNIRNGLVLPVIFEWANFFQHPLDRILLPYIASQVGFVVAFHQVVAFIHWPLLLATVCALWVGRPSRDGFRGMTLLFLLAGFFVLEQLVSAAFDFESPPRRSLPFVFAFAFAYCWSVNRFFANGRWRFVFAACFLFSAFFAFADVVFDRGGGAFLYVGEAIAIPKDVMRYETRQLPREPAAPRDPQQELRGSFPAAKWNFSGAFAFAQIFVAFWTLLPFWMGARARLLPRALPWAAAGVWLVSLGVRCV